MSGPNHNQHSPEPRPENIFKEEWWMVTGEWYVVVQESAIATAENPTAQGRRVLKRICMTEVINMHPIAHVVSSLSQGRGSYAVLDSLPITKAQYEWVMSAQPPDVASEVADMADRIENEKRTIDESTTDVPSKSN